VQHRNNSRRYLPCKLKGKVTGCLQKQSNPHIDSRVTGVASYGRQTVLVFRLVTVMARPLTDAVKRTKVRWVVAGVGGKHAFLSREIPGHPSSRLLNARNSWTRNSWKKFLDTHRGFLDTHEPSRIPSADFGTPSASGSSWQDLKRLDSWTPIRSIAELNSGTPN